jgi:hypothetical protein
MVLYFQSTRHDYCTFSKLNFQLLLITVSKVLPKNSNNRGALLSRFDNWTIEGLAKL